MTPNFTKLVRIMKLQIQEVHRTPSRKNTKHTYTQPQAYDIQTSENERQKILTLLRRRKRKKKKTILSSKEKAQKLDQTSHQKLFKQKENVMTYIKYYTGWNLSTQNPRSS